MSIQDLENQISYLTDEQKKDLLKKIQTIIDHEYVSKDQMLLLQKKIDILMKQNEEKAYDVSSKFSRKENQTIAFQLGKAIIEISKKQIPISKVPQIGINLFLESLQRKKIENLNEFQKGILALLNYQKTLEQKTAKDISIDVLKLILNKLENTTVIDKESYINSTFMEIGNNYPIQPELDDYNISLTNKYAYSQTLSLSGKILNIDKVNVQNRPIVLHVDKWIKDAEDISINLYCEPNGGLNGDAIGIVKIYFCDSEGNILNKTGLTNLSWSDSLNCWYFYLVSGNNNYNFIKPSIASKFILSFEKWKCESISIKSPIKLVRKPSILQIIRQDYAGLINELSKPISVCSADKVEGRLCYVLNHSLPYQSEGYATRAQGLAKAIKNNEIDILCLSRPGFPSSFLKDFKDKKVPKFELIDSVPYHRINKGLRWKGTYNYIRKAADELQLKFQELKPSCVMAASDYKNAMPALLAARRLGLPFIYEIRGFWEVTQESKDPSVVKTSNYHLTRYLEIQVALKADYVFTLTQAMRQDLITRGVPAEKIGLLPNSCNPEDFKVNIKNKLVLDQLNIPRTVPVIGYIGTFNSYEGLDDLMHACGHLFKSGLQFRVLLVGAKPSKDSAAGLLALQLKDIAKTYGFSDWVIMPGRIAHHDVSKYYSLIDITPFTRKPLPVTELVSPIKPLEAMAMEKAVVSSSVHALSEMIIHGETGLVYEKGDINDLAQKIQLLLNDSKLRLSLGKAAREWVIKERTWDLCAKKVKQEVLSLEGKSSVQILDKKRELPSKKACEYKVAFIVDEFTYNSFKDEFIPIIIEPDNWEKLFKEHKPDIFFCESAWSGVDSIRRPWQGKIYTSVNWERENRTVLLKILAYCKKEGIPTIFWNKEDPTHFTDRVHDFIPTAKEFDYVFTTAEECCESYKTEYGVKNVYALPFATNPKLFNPILNSERKNKVVFAGSWYANHEARSKDMEFILDSLLTSGFELEIYDRYYGMTDELHVWPQRYQKYLKPSVPHAEMPEVYKSSVMGLNFNTVTDSSTMFARRVFELMSSNTLVVSNYSKGVDMMFGDLVIFADKDSNRLKGLSLKEIDRLRERALNLVLTKHTYTNRWQEILTKIGAPWIQENDDITFIYKVMTKQDIDTAIDHYQKNYMSRSGSQILLLVDERVSALDITGIYTDYNRAGINVTCMHHIKNYALEGKYNPIETKYFVYTNIVKYPDAQWIDNARLHMSYLDETYVSPCKLNAKPYKFVKVKKVDYLFAASEQFGQAMLDIFKQSIRTYTI